MKASLTVYFEDPFWVGVFERIEDGKLSVCKVTFGAEPKDYDVLDFVLHHYYELAFSPAIEIETRQAADNAKRRSRNARFVAVHSVMNKASGVLLFLLLLTIPTVPLRDSAIVTCAAATFAAIQEGHFIRTERE